MVFSPKMPPGSPFLCSARSPAGRAPPRTQPRGRSKPFTPPTLKGSNHCGSTGKENPQGRSKIFFIKPSPAQRHQDLFRGEAAQGSCLLPKDGTEPLSPSGSPETFARQSHEAPARSDLPSGHLLKAPSKVSCGGRSDRSSGWSTGGATRGR